MAGEKSNTQRKQFDFTTSKNRKINHAFKDLHPDGDTTKKIKGVILSGRLALGCWERYGRRLAKQRWLCGKDNTPFFGSHQSLLRCYFIIH